MRRALRLAVVLLVPLVVIAAMVWIVGFRETARAIRQTGFLAFLSLGALAAALLLVQSLAWATLNRPVGHRVPFRSLYSASLVGFAVNIVTPSAYLGGEPAKILYIRRRTRLPVPAIAGTVILGKYLEGLSFVLCVSAAVTVAAVAFRHVLFHGSGLALGVPLVIVSATLLSLAIVLWVSLRRGAHPLTGITRWIRRFSPRSRRLCRLERKTREMEDQILRVFAEERRTALLAFCCYLMEHTGIFLRPALFFALGGRIFLGPAELGMIYVAGQALLAFQITPSGVGTLDGGMIGIFALLGLPAAPCVAFLLAIRFWDAATVVAGSVLGARVGAEVLSGGPAEAPAAS